MKRATVIGAVLAAIATVALVGGAGAQDEVLPHPSHIHVGSCPDVGDVIAGLSPVTAVAGTAIGSATAIAVESGVTTAPVAFADIFAGPHAIVVHRSEPEIAVYIACGDLGGVPMGATDIAVGLGELNDSGYSGVATLHDGGDGSTTVMVFVTGSGEGGGEPAESPEG